MAWTPTKNVLTPRAIPENLLTYCTDATRQADALTWAGGTGYKAVRKYTTSALARTTPKYPCIAYNDDNDAQVFEDDAIASQYSVTFRVSVQNSNVDTATTQARVYAKALLSLLINCDTLDDNTGAYASNIEGVEVGFMPIKTNEQQNDFLQEFDIRITVSLYGSTHA